MLPEIVFWEHPVVQLRLYASIIVFLGSYLPLSLILLAQDFRYDLLNSKFCFPLAGATDICGLPLRNPEFSIPIFAVCLLCFFTALFVLGTLTPNRPIQVIEAKYVPSELMSYTLPYVVSFMSIDYQDTGKFVGLIIFLIWMFLITFRSGQLIMNPILIVFGWRLHEIKYRFPRQTIEHISTSLAKSKVTANTRYLITSFQDVLIAEEAQKD
jgi:hypothetical protein